MCVEILLYGAVSPAAGMSDDAQAKATIQAEHHTAQGPEPPRDSETFKVQEIDFKGFRAISVSASCLLA